MKDKDDLRREEEYKTRKQDMIYEERKNKIRHK